ncbi:MAG: pacL [Acidobacteria bacterium]|nr:pacL [Acidobacteriota bacterium]
MIVVLGLLRGEALPELLLSAVSLALAAAPEALTAEVTIDLWLVAQRLLRRHALICKLPAVETLGSVTVICSDKTGALTLNRMTVTALDIANHAFGLVEAADELGFELMALEQSAGHAHPACAGSAGGLHGGGAENNSPSGW